MLKKDSSLLVDNFPSPWNAQSLKEAPSPSFIVSETLLKRNLEMLKNIQDRTGAKILLALKGFAMWSVFPLLQNVLHGVCASSPNEAILGREEFGKEVHAFAAAYSDSDVQTLLPIVDHLLFNSFNQWQKFKPLLEQQKKDIEIGLRINPEHSEGAVAIYNPCSVGSRLGIRLKDFEKGVKDFGLSGISGLHFHTLCEQNSDALARTLDIVEQNFSKYFKGLKWLNFGGGHHITREDYDVDLLCRCIERIQNKYKLQVYLEPGEAVALNTGVFKTTVLDVVQADLPIAILDSSAPTHMPDVLEMPYRPNIFGAGDADGGTNVKKYLYRLAGKSCLAGDVIGEYSFDEPLTPGMSLYFLDMAHYSMVKTTTFNGLGLPDITLLKEDASLKIIRTFGYEDFKMRLS
ncbi:carboxynorspermidine decarboxylase [Desulfovibrio litoralis]|uniref:Carboxynorspermidine/carboxyspermidine decarboxylase n=1 Tax=Desulfovibrio litoralis DSM 11393 TaxID=1121455 RepID=A0A1M7SMK1_9BACT|nr:carboxynorspermidine decarboxylase [Desulfovibrio litoralis]SHN59700.1 carboxynorspermidine decarboxylase [Desulfovibrio litoralis DSM 11393]